MLIRHVRSGAKTGLPRPNVGRQKWEQLLGRTIDDIPPGRYIIYGIGPTVTSELIKCFSIDS